MVHETGGGGHEISDVTAPIRAIGSVDRVDSLLTSSVVVAWANSGLVTKDGAVPHMLAGKKSQLPDMAPSGVRQDIYWMSLTRRT